jgi:hypothetical protein
MGGLVRTAGAVRLVTLLGCVLVLAGWPAVAASEGAGARRPDLTGGFPDRPYFEPNVGQVDARVKFLGRARGLVVYLTETDAVLALGDATVRMRLVGANPAPRIAGAARLPGTVNYFIGDDPARWRTGVPTYASVGYRDVYPGVDLVYYGQRGQLEYDFVVAPGVDPGVISLAFEGAESVATDARGDLVLRTASGDVRFLKPHVYQVIDGVRRPVAAGYRMVAAGRVGFQVAAHDATRPLVIDPILLYSSYLGGAGAEKAAAIAIDGAGHAYVAGETASLNFPTTSGAFQRSAGGRSGRDAFVAKLNTGVGGAASLVYATYIGGSGHDQAHGIAVDAAGNAYVTGQTFSTNFPASPLKAGNRGSSDAFLVKLNAAGSVLLYSAFLGGSSDDAGYGVAVEPGTGLAWVTGQTFSTNFPATTGAFQRTPGDAGTQGDAFLARVNTLASGSASLHYATYLGGTGADRGLGVATDGAGHAHVTGFTGSTGLATPSAFEPTHSGGQDAFVARINPALAGAASLVYFTYLGGTGNDVGQGIAVESSSPDCAGGCTYVVGQTSSPFPSLPVTANAYQLGLLGPTDAFVAKLDPTGAAALYLSYFGGSGDESASAVAVDAAGKIYATGVTTSLDLPVGAYQPGLAGGQDVFVAKFDPALGGAASLAYFTYLGGDRDDAGHGIAVDTRARAHVTGTTASANFPTALAFDPTCGVNGLCDGLSDAFVAVLETDVTAPAITLTTPAHGSATNNTTPLFAGVAGMAPGDAATVTVKIYLGTSASGPPVQTLAATRDGTTGAYAVAAAALAEGVYTARAQQSDDAGNTGFSTANTFTVDTTRPTVTIDQAAGQEDPTNGSPIRFTVVFSEPVGGFTGEQVTIGGTAGGSKTVVVTGGPATYTVAVSGMTDGTVVATIAEGVAVDAAGNPNMASTSTDNAVTFDGTRPTVTIDQAAGQADPTNGAPIHFTVVFSEPVGGFTGEQVTIGGTAGGSKTVVVTGGPSAYTVAVSGMTDGTVVATIAEGVVTDAAGNPNTASTSTDNTVTYDTTRPAVTIDQAVDQADPTNSSPIRFTVVFSEPVTGFAGNQVTIGGTAGGSKTVVVTGGPSAYTVAVSGMTDGTVVATIGAGVVADAAGNPNTASTSTDDTVTYDTTPPVFGAVSNLMFQVGTTVTYPTPTATDAVTSPPPVVCDPASGSPAGGAAFPLGDTTVTCTATDAAGNSSVIDFFVTVQNDAPPVLGIDVPSQTFAQGEPITLTASITVGQSTTTIGPDCVNTTFTIRRLDGSVVEPRFRERIYGIPNDLVNIAANAPFVIRCDITEAIDPSLLPPGQYRFFATYANYIQDLDPTPPQFDVWTGSINSPERDLTIVAPEVRPAVIRIVLDIKPGGFPNSANCSGGGGLPMAVLSGEIFDPSAPGPDHRRLFDPVAEVDTGSVRFGRTGTETGGGNVGTADVNGDGVLDLIFHPSLAQSGFSCADLPAGQQSTEVVGILTGQTRLARPFSGSDTIRLVTGTAPR